MIIQS